jgi:uncharacterized Zn finger protein
MAPPTSPTLRERFAQDELRRLAGPRAYLRGAAYHAQGRVTIVEAGRGRVAATVQGTVVYAVELWLDGGERGWSCTCPAAEEGDLCKHAVALGLALAAGVDVGPLDVGPLDVDLADHVARLERERLVELVLELAARDPDLRQRLRAEASGERAAPLRSPRE